MILDGYTFIPHPANWAEDVNWSRRWQTTIAPSLAGAEDRAALRQRPMVALDFLVTPRDAADQERLDALIRQALKSGRVAVPYWGRSATVATDVTGTTVTLVGSTYLAQLDDYLFFDFGNGFWDVRKVHAIPGPITLDAAVSATWPAGAQVWPVLLGRLVVDDTAVETSHRAGTRLRVMDDVGTPLRGVGGGFANITTPSWSSYLSQPVFPFATQWQDEPTRRFDYDLRLLQIGFGAQVATGQQAHVVHGFELSYLLQNETEIETVDAFCGVVRGSLAGFWLAASLETSTIQAGVSTTVFNIADADLADTWTEHPDIHLAFTAPGESVPSRFAQIASVTDLGDGIEQVTLTAALASIINADWVVSRLHFVRLAGDEEQGTFLADGLQRRSLRVVELPTEYAAAATGTQPVYLYEFTTPAPLSQTWRYTSFARDVVSSSQTFTAYPISHGSWRRTITMDPEEMGLDLLYGAGGPLAGHLPGPAPVAVNLKVWSVAYAAPNTRTLLFSGTVRSPEFRGTRITAKASAWAAELERKGPWWLIQPRCNYHLYDVNCGVPRASYQITGSLTAVNREVIDVDVGTTISDSEYWDGGELVIGTGGLTQRRTIIRASLLTGTTWRLTISHPLGSLTLPVAAVVAPGCNGLYGTCKTKFGNHLAFGGCPWVPQRNPTLQTITPNNNTGKK